MKYFVAVVVSICVTGGLFSQDISYGLKAGLSFSKHNGDLVDGESNSYRSGFHVGPTARLGFTDELGVRIEILYNQLGSRYKYEGPSYLTIRNTLSEAGETFFGEKDMTLDHFASYIDIPISASYKTGPIELHLGFNILTFIGGSAGGNIRLNTNSQELRTTLDYRYNRDELGEADFNGGSEVLIGGVDYIVPDNVGAYYEHKEKDGRTFNTFDFGLHAGVSVFLNDALYLSGRFYYGLSDVTNDNMDLKQNLTQQTLGETSDDKDNNLSMQFSLGFAF